MSPETRDVELTDGPLVEPLVVLSVPVILTNLLQVGYNAVDTFWVGRLGGAAVAALSFSWAIVFLVISLACGFSIAGTVLIAQNKGADDHERIRHVAGQTLLVVLSVALVVSIVGYVYAPELLGLVGADAGSEEHLLAVTYTRTMFVGTPFVFGFFVFQSLLQGWGDTRTPFYLMVFSVGLNVLLDPILILGFHENVLFEWLGLGGIAGLLFDLIGFTGLGIQGAAVATVLARAVVAVVGIYWLLSGRVGIRLSAADLAPRWGTIRRIVQIGAPSSVEISTKALSVTLLTALVAIAGPKAVAAYGIGSRITAMALLPPLGLSRGVETVVGQNLGAGRTDRASRGVIAATGIVAGCLLVAGVGVYFAADQLVGIFVAGEAARSVAGIGADYLRIVGVSYVFLGVFYVVQGGFRGSGSTTLAMTFAFVGFVVFRVALAYAFAVPGGLGATGIWYGEAVANVLMAVLAGLYFLRGTWAGPIIDDTDPGTLPGPDPGSTTVSMDE